MKKFLLLLTLLLSTSLSYADGPQLPPLRVREQDGSPNAIPVFDIRVSNGTMTNDGNGVIQLTTGGGGSGANVSGWTDAGAGTIEEVVVTDDVGIGATPNGKLSVTGDTDETQFFIKGNGTQTNKHLILAVASDNSTRFALSGDGSVTFAGTGTPSARFGSGLTATYPITFDLVGTDPLMYASSGNISTSGTFTISGDQLNMLTNTKGGILASNGTGFIPLAVGATNGMVLSVDSTAATGLKWGFASGGSGTGHKVFINLPISSAKLSQDGYARIDGGFVGGSTPYTMWRLLFDDNAENSAGKNIALWQGRMDDNWSGGSLTAKIGSAMLSSDSTSTVGGAVTYGVSIWALTSGDAASLTTESYDTENTKTQGVPTVMSRDQTVSIPLTNVDSLAAGDWFMVKLRRNGADSITGDSVVTSFAITE